MKNSFKNPGKILSKRMVERISLMKILKKKVYEKYCVQLTFFTQFGDFDNFLYRIVILTIQSMIVQSIFFHIPNVNEVEWVHLD